jgi:hypothetical protein
MVALVCYVTAFTRASGSGSKVQNQSMALPSFVYIFLAIEKQVTRVTQAAQLSHARDGGDNASGSKNIK